MAALSLGDPAPTFELPATDGKQYAVLDSADPRIRATVVYWTCNHCPYAIAWHDRLIEVAREYGEQDVMFLAINSNDSKKKPEDSFDAMKERVKTEGNWPHPYLYDESQEVAKEYGAKKTPDIFVFDAELKLRYHGAPDADYEDPSQEAAWLRAAIDDLLGGRTVEMAQSEPVGCTIKWK
jgi:peroxiredoxin